MTEGKEMRSMSTVRGGVHKIAKHAIAWREVVGDGRFLKPQTSRMESLHGWAYA